MIAYPDDVALRRQSDEHGIPPVVLVRDVVRVVEVLNLKRRAFFNKDSVLAGSMALRCFGSPRFTVFDADFSTSASTVNPPERMVDLLRYSDDDLDIDPSALEADTAGTMFKSSPITFVPAFTALAPGENDRQFKADISMRGLVLDGREIEFITPYDLELWSDAPVVHIMDPAEILAEKILGWTVNRRVKHYADAAWIARASTEQGSSLTFDYRVLRDVLHEKLGTMSQIQPDTYRHLPTVDAVIGSMNKPAQFDQKQWQELVYLKQHRRAYDENVLQAIVKEILLPGLRRAAPR